MSGNAQALLNQIKPLIQQGNDKHALAAIEDALLEANREGYAEARDDRDDD